MKNKLIIVSGGMDSTTLLYLKKDEIKLALSFDYGQKHNKEINFAKKNCESLGIEHRIIDLKFLNSLLRSNLLQSGQEIPNGHYTEKIMEKTVVPFRNGIMLSIAVGIAESENLVSVLIANHSGDHFIYPDCRPEFIDAFDKASKFGTLKNIRIESPFCNLTKREIALIGKELSINYGEWTWSCYKGKEIHCGVCGTCVERKEALEGFDNTKYEK